MFRNSMLNVFEKMNDVIRISIYFAGYVATQWDFWKRRQYDTLRGFLRTKHMVLISCVFSKKEATTYGIDKLRVF